MIVADTDVLIDALNGVEPVRSRIDAELSAGLATTAITSFELLSGARREKEKVRIRQLLAAWLTNYVPIRGSLAFREHPRLRSLTPLTRPWRATTASHWIEMSKLQGGHAA